MTILLQKLNQNWFVFKENKIYKIYTKKFELVMQKIDQCKKNSFTIEISFLIFLFQINILILIISFAFGNYIDLNVLFFGCIVTLIIKTWSWS